MSMNLKSTLFGITGFLMFASVYFFIIAPRKIDYKVNVNTTHITSDCSTFIINTELLITCDSTIKDSINNRIKNDIISKINSNYNDVNWEYIKRAKQTSIPTEIKELILSKYNKFKPRELNISITLGKKYTNRVDKLPKDIRSLIKDVKDKTEKEITNNNNKLKSQINTIEYKKDSTISILLTELDIKSSELEYLSNSTNNKFIKLIKDVENSNILNSNDKKEKINYYQQRILDNEKFYTNISDSINKINDNIILGVIKTCSKTKSELIISINKTNTSLDNRCNLQINEIINNYEINRDKHRQEELLLITKKKYTEKKGQCNKIEK